MVDPEVPSLLQGDPGRLRQILTNLASNTIKFTQAGEVSTMGSLIQKLEERVKLRFEVSDTGIGIPENRIDQLFKSFSQMDASTTRQYGGTGLGLAISKSLVETMGGKIGVESIDRRGSLALLFFNIIGNIHKKIFSIHHIKFIPKPPFSY